MESNLETGMAKATVHAKKIPEQAWIGWTKPLLANRILGKPQKATDILYILSYTQEISRVQLPSRAPTK